jgi:hypothetical protein
MLVALFGTLCVVYSWLCKGKLEANIPVYTVVILYVITSFQSSQTINDVQNVSEFAKSFIAFAKKSFIGFASLVI